MGDPADRAQEHFPARLGYGTVEVKKIKRVAGRPNEEITETFTGFLANSRLVAREGESNEITELYLSFRDNGDTPSLYKLIQIKIGSLRDKAKDGIALTDDEVKEIRDLISWCPGGEEALKWQAELRGVAEEQIMGEDPANFQDTAAVQASKDWDALRARDRQLGNQQAKQEAQEVEERNGFVADLYLICSSLGIDPQTLRLSDFIRERLVKENRQTLLVRLIAEEDNRSGAGNRRRERGLTEEWVINPTEYWNRQLLGAMETRLGAMRSSAVSFLKKNPNGQKMEIGRPQNSEHFIKGFSPSLSVNTVEDKTEVGKFLDKMHRGAYWHGKACIDVLYWSIYKGQLMGDSASRSEARDPDQFSNRTKLSEYLREYAGVVALSYMEKDPQFIDALNILYGLYPDKTYEQKLEILSRRHGNFNINGELPDFVTDAVMFEKVYVRDALNMSRGDLRILAYHPAQINDNEYVTDTQGKVMKFFGKNMRFTESPMMKMGWWDASNARFNYEAMVPDLREYDPEKHWDQKDKTWQFQGMFLLEANGRRPDLKRKITDEGEEIQINGKPMTVTSGQTGEFLNYQNERRKRKKGERRWVYDHRRGVFERIKDVFKDDARLVAERGFGKAGWDDLVDDNWNTLVNTEADSSLTYRKAVEIFVSFLEIDFSGRNKLVINGVTIDKGKGEIFYNDQLAVLLNDFEANPDDSSFAKNKNELLGFLNMRNVLREMRCWGYTFDLNEKEVQDRVFDNLDLTFADSYDIAASESVKLLKKLFSSEATADVYALEVTPAQVLAAITEFGHRRNKTQNYWPMMHFLAFVEAGMLMRLTQMEIVSIQDLNKYIDPTGQVKLGATTEIERLLGVRREAYLAHKEVLGTIEAKGYMDSMKDRRLVLAELGLIRNWTNAMRSMVERLRDAEALQWAQQRDIPLQQMAGIYEEIADGYDESGYFPVESYQVMNVVKKGYEILRRNLLIQSLNRTQIETFFERMSFEEAGEVFGGARTITLNFNRFPDTFFREAPDLSSHKVEADIDRNNSQNYLLVQREEKNGSKWMKIATEDGEEVGWVGEDKVDFEYNTNPIPNPATTPLRLGEVTYKGGRFMWMNKTRTEKNPGKWQWQWVEGNWQQVFDGMRSVYKFIPGDGFERRLQLGTVGEHGSVKILLERRKAMIEELMNEGVSKAEAERQTEWMKVKDSELQEIKVIYAGMMRVQPANYPWLKFKSEEHREYFYNGRQAMLLSLIMGKSVEAGRAVGEGAEAPRASGAALSPSMYQNSVGNFMQVTQFGYWITTQMRSVEARVACRGALMATLKGYFGVETPSNEMTERRMELFKMLMQGRLWGEIDRKNVETFNKEISPLAFLRRKNKDFTQRLKGAVKRTPGKLINKAIARLLGMGMAITNAEWKIFNVPTALLTGQKIYSLIKLSFVPEDPAPLLSTGIYSAGIYFGVKFLVNGVGAFLAGLIDPDVSDADLSQFPYLLEYDAYVPVE